MSPKQYGKLYSSLNTRAQLNYKEPHNIILLVVRKFLLDLQFISSKIKVLLSVWLASLKPKHKSGDNGRQF